MANPWHDVSPGAHAPAAVAVIIETRGNSRNKYELDKTNGIFKLDRVLQSSVHYPGDYGFIPQTLFEDGDPLDVLLLIREPTHTGCLVDARPIGVLRMRDGGEPDDKILAVPTNDPYQREFLDIDDIPQHILREVEYFFGTYKTLERKHVEIRGWDKSEAAAREITRSMDLYRLHYAIA